MAKKTKHFQPSESNGIISQERRSWNGAHRYMYLWYPIGAEKKFDPTFDISSDAV